MLLGMLLGVGCAHPRPAHDPPARVPTAKGRTTTNRAERAAAAPTGDHPQTPERAPHPAPPRPPPPAACGPLNCLAFDRPVSALEYVLRDSPRVLGIGEAHALAGSEREASTAELFWRDLLPGLEGRASHLIVELLRPKPACGKSLEAARGVARQVGRGQSKAAKNHYVELGHRAKARGIVPFLLSPTCVEYRRIAEAGPERLGVMLEVIATVTARMTRQALAGLERAGSQQLVVTYGGALHNDLEPDEVRRPWSYGPELQRATGGRYVELDLIRRDQVGESPAWQRLPWYEHFRSGRLPMAETVLLEPRPGSYVLFFPSRGSPSASSKRNLPPGQ